MLSLVLPLALALALALALVGNIFSGFNFLGLLLAPALNTVFAHKMAANLTIINDNEAEKI